MARRPFPRGGIRVRLPVLWRRVAASVAAYVLATIGGDVLMTIGNEELRTIQDG